MKKQIKLTNASDHGFGQAEMVLDQARRKLMGDAVWELLSETDPETGATTLVLKIAGKELEPPPPAQ